MRLDYPLSTDDRRCPSERGRPLAGDPVLRTALGNRAGLVLKPAHGCGTGVIIGPAASQREWGKP
jgi:hypothetical protein